jgi:hypothetical protein
VIGVPAVDAAAIPGAWRCPGQIFHVLEGQVQLLRVNARRIKKVRTASRGLPLWSSRRRQATTLPL